MEPSRSGPLVRLALLLEREARLIGVDVEAETTRIIDKLKLRRDRHENE